MEHRRLISRIKARWRPILWAGVAILMILPVAVSSTGAYESYLAAGSLLPVGLIGLMVTFRHPILGLTLLLLACMASPIEVGPVPAAALVVAFLAFIFLLKVLLFRTDIEISRPVIPLLVFLCIASISFVSGQFPWLPTAPAPLKAQLGGLGIFWLSGLTFLLVLYQVRDPASLRKLTWLFLFVGGIILLGYAVPGGAVIISYTGGSMGSLFWIWYVSLAFGQVFFNPTLHGLARFALAGIALFALGFRVFGATASVSGWFPCVIAVLVLLVIGAPKLALALSLIAGSVVIFQLDAIVEKIWVQEQYSLFTRWEALKTLWKVVKSNPILGLGPSNYYFYTELFPLMGWYVKFNSHNNYLDLLAQTGFAGVASFFWFSFEVARSGWNLLAGMERGFEKAYTYGALAGLAGTLTAGALGDWFLPFVYNVGLSGLKVSLIGWFFLGGLVALEQMRKTARYGTSQLRAGREEPELPFRFAPAR